MRRGTLEKTKKPVKAAVGTTLEDKTVARRSAVEEVLDMLKSGKKDMAAAAKIVNNAEGNNAENFVSSLEQLSDVLCSIGYFQKAIDLLNAGLKYLPKNPTIHELIARVYFIMEHFDKCIIHQEKAIEYKGSTNCFSNHSDIGLAYYRLGIQQANSKSFDQAFKHCRLSLTENPRYANAMVNMGLVYRH